MTKITAPLAWAFGAASIVLAIIWPYASHRYDCLNIGPCKDGVDFWNNLNTIACYGFLASWAGLVVTVIAMRISPARRALALCAAALTIPPATTFLASWTLNLGVSVAST